MKRPQSHPSLPATQTRLATLLAGLAHEDGMRPSHLPGVGFMRSSRNVPRTPMVYEPGIFIVAQGRKTGFLGGRKIIYDANHYLVMSVPLPFECETEGSPDHPLLGLSIQVTPAIVAELLLQMRHTPAFDHADTRVMQSAPLDARLHAASLRLVESLRHEDETRILGPQIVREIIYLVLGGKLGRNLRAVAAPESQAGRISRVLHRLHTHFAQPHDVPQLAREAGMSVSAFHARFKTVTASSPLQYLKNVRLHKALQLMLHEGANAGTAALQVGYESASQFSREFKTRFGDSPAAVATQMRAAINGRAN